MIKEKLDLKKNISLSVTSPPSSFTPTSPVFLSSYLLIIMDIITRFTNSNCDYHLAGFLDVKTIITMMEINKDTNLKAITLLTKTFLKTNHPEKKKFLRSRKHPKTGNTYMGSIGFVTVKYEGSLTGYSRGDHILAMFNKSCTVCGKTCSKTPYGVPTHTKCLKEFEVTLHQAGKMVGLKIPIKEYERFNRRFNIGRWKREIAYDNCLVVMGENEVCLWKNCFKRWYVTTMQ